jgi:hypothetical protein
LPATHVRNPSQAVGISLSWVAMVLVPKEYDTHVTPTFLMELSTVMLDAMWLLTAFGRGKSTAHRVFTALFALSFLVTRVIGLPAYLLYIRQHHPAMWASIGTMGKVGCSTLVGLMWFWGWKVGFGQAIGWACVRRALEHAFWPACALGSTRTCWLLLHSPRYAALLPVYARIL